MAGPLADAPTGIHEAFSAGLPVHIGASVHGVGEHVVDGGVGGYDPADALEPRHLEREVQLFGAEPQPHPASRAELAEAVEDGADGTSDGFVGMEADLAILLAPDEPNRQTTPQLATGRLVADAAIEARTQDVEFSLGHGALQPQHQTVVEVAGVIEAVIIGEQRVGDPAQVQQTVPISVVACESGQFQAKDDADVTECHLGREVAETRADGDAVGRGALVFIDDDYLVALPTELERACDELVLASSRLGVTLDLARAGLPHIDDGQALAMGRCDLAEVDHYISSLRRWPATRRQ